jgi:hypothetical protein
MRHAIYVAALTAFACPGLAFAQAPDPSAAPASTRSIAKDSRAFELRTYYAQPGKLEDLHARFRQHTIRLFEKHGMTVVAFWAPTAPAEAASWSRRWSR